MRYIPGFQEYNSGRWVVADLHVHSSYSGGSLSPRELLMLENSLFLDALAIADHHQVAGAREGEEFSAGNAGCPLVLAAQEVSLGDHFHVLAIGCNDGWPDGNRNQLLQKIKTHHQSGGIIIIAHPWTLPKTSWAAGCLKEMLIEQMIDGIELFNSSILEFDQGAELRLRSTWENLILPNSLAIVGGSDFHYHRQGRQIGAGRTYLKVYRPGIPGIIEALKNRRAVAGLFSYKPFEFGFFGSGQQLIFGNDPWHSQLQDLINKLHNRIQHRRISRSSLVTKLITAGHYQYAWDLVEAGF